MEQKIRVLVVDDSALIRKIITEVLNSDKEIEVVDTAKNGLEALQKIKILHPSVITMDIEMPVMDGLTCLKEIMKEEYIPIVMLSALSEQGAEVTIKALEYGAVDFIAKPTNLLKVTDNQKIKEIIEKVKAAAGAEKSKKPLIESVKWIDNKKYNISEGNEYIRHLIAIGSSTGGPKALQNVVTLLPEDISAAFLIVQHMPAGFTKSFAERLNNLSAVTVKEAEDGDVIRRGYVYIAPGDNHMLVEKKANGIRIKLSHDPPEDGHRPSVNTMMNSLSDTGLNNIVAVIMTGMGRDGSEGIRKLKKENNAYIIAQDEKSCVVYGMPKAAVQTGVVDAVVPLDEIASEIMKIVRGQK